MEIKDLTMGKKLNDEELEQVAGGKWVQRKAWSCCGQYVCQSCGSTSPYINKHAPGCPVSAIRSTNTMKAHLNGCWSCKHVWYGENYPKDETDLWCNK